MLLCFDPEKRVYPPCQLLRPDLSVLPEKPNRPKYISENLKLPARRKEKAAMFEGSRPELSRGLVSSACAFAGAAHTCPPIRRGKHGTAGKSPNDSPSKLTSESEPGGLFVVQMTSGQTCTANKYCMSPRHSAHESSAGACMSCR